MKNESPQAQEEVPELKPCPFCAETPTANNYYMNQGSKWGGIVCGNCGVQGPEVRTHYAPWEHWKWEAVKEWNTRADLPRAAADDGSDDWCDDCHAYSHLPFCPSYRSRNDPLVDRLVDAVYRSMQQYDDGTWLLDNLKAKARVNRILAATPRVETGLTVEAWQPIETAPKNEEWCVVGKISDGKVLWWYRAMFWRGGWHTSRSYDTRIAPSHYLPLPQ